MNLTERFGISLLIASMAAAGTQGAPLLSTNQSNYLDSEPALFTISGAPAGSKIYWGSSVDGASTGEGEGQGGHGSYYGQVVGADGTWSAYGSDWNKLPHGLWSKTATFDDGTKATIKFNVEKSIQPAAGRTGSRGSPFRTAIGVADWGGTSAGSKESNLLQSAKAVGNLGAENILLALSPNYSVDYPGTPFGTPSSLTQLAQTQAFKAVLDLPFQTLSIDVAPFSNLNPILAKSQNLDQVKREMHDLAVYLLRRYAGSGKTFVLKNWEGDNLLASDPLRATAADAKKMIAWINAMHAGLIQARQELGDMGVTVEDAVEFNSLSKPRHDEVSMLDDVIPFVKSDLVSYSSYDTINAPATADLEASVVNDLEYIRHSPGMNGRSLIIGEWGVPQKLPDQAARIQAIANAFSDEGIPLANYWQMIDSGAADAEYGLIHPDGSKSPAYGTLQRLVEPSGLIARSGLGGPVGFKAVRPVAGKSEKTPYYISSQAPNHYTPLSTHPDTPHPVTYIEGPSH